MIAKYLTLRGNTYYVRIPLQQSIITILGRAEVKRSLRTKSKLEASLKALLYRDYIEKLQRRIIMSINSPSSNNKAKEIAIKWFDEQLEKFEADIRANGFVQVESLTGYESDDDDLYDELLARKAEESYMKYRGYQDKVNRGKYSEDDNREVVGHLEELDDEHNEDSLFFTDLRYNLYFLKSQLHRIQYMRYRGDHSLADEVISSLREKSSHNKLSQVSSSQSEPEDKPLGWLIEEFMSELRVTESNRKNYEQAFKLFLELHGKSATITWDLANRTAKALQTLPTNRSIRPQYRELSVHQLLELEDIPEEHLFKPKNINKYLDIYKQLFKWAKVRRYISLDDEPFSPLKVKDKVRAKDKRQPFKTEGLIKLFSHPTWADGKYKEPYRYWLPLLGLFTGARLNELCQLCVSDVREDGGSFLISINEAHPNNKLKNDHSERLIPIHPYIIRLGFIEYVNSVKSDHEHQRLFPSLTYGGQKNGYGNKATKWFQRLKTELGFGRGEGVFHSLRHTFVDFYTNVVPIDDERTEYLTGHAPTTMRRETYGNRPSQEVCREVINELDFEKHLTMVKPYTDFM